MHFKKWQEMWDCTVFQGWEERGGERTKPSWDLSTVERLINEALGMHHYLRSFGGKTWTIMTSSRDLDHLFLSNSSFCLGGVSSSPILCIIHLTSNHRDILVDWTSVCSLYWLTFHVFVFSWLRLGAALGAGIVFHPCVYPLTAHYRALVCGGSSWGENGNVLC